jgi:hypothetical protein
MGDASNNAFVADNSEIFTNTLFVTCIERQEIVFQVYAVIQNFTWDVTVMCRLFNTIPNGCTCVRSVLQMIGNLRNTQLLFESGIFTHQTIVDCSQAKKTKQFFFLGEQ